MVFYNHADIYPDDNSFCDNVRKDAQKIKKMRIETEKLIIRSIEKGEEKVFTEMARPVPRSLKYNI